MTPERYQKAGHLYHAALEIEPEGRAAFLDGECDSDEEVRREVESLLAAHDKVGNYFAAPALEIAAGLLAGRQNLSLMGQRLSHYRVLSLIGAGGMGEVYLAEDTRLGRKVALKLLPKEFTEDPDRVRRFELEARSASSLNHPNIVTIFEVGQVDGRHFIATEYIDGQTLRERLSGAQLEVREALDVAAQVASALEAAHDAGIVHRDIKPENVMVRRDGLVKVLDFGLAKLTERPSLGAGSEAMTVVGVETTPGLVLGTVSYMSPEQARGLKVDARSDNFSLGVVMYEMVAGRCPSEGATASDVMAAILQNEPLPLSRFAQNVPDELERIVAKALRKDREERYQTASDLSVDLKSLKLAVQPDRKADRGAFPFRRAWALVGSLVVLLSVTTLLYFWVSRSPKPLADRAAPKSIAVLPFKPLIAAERDPVYELGLANSLIFTFSAVKELTVRPIESMRKYMNLDLDPVAVGREQGVDFVLASHYQISGDKIRVTSQLINVNDGSTFETFKCDETCTNIFETQDAISLRVGQQLLAKLTDEQRRLLTKRYTENKEAYDLYLKGWNSWGKFTEEDLKEGVKYFEQALAKDSKYALAYHGLTACHLVLGILYVDPREEMPKAKVAATKAREIDDTIAETHTSLGGVAFFYDWDWETAEREFKRAIELDPNLVRAHHWYGDYLMAMERHNEAIAEFGEMNRAQELAGLFGSNETRALFYAGRYDEAIEKCNKLSARDAVGETDRILGLSYWKKGMRDLAIDALIKANTFSGAMPRTIGPLGYVYAMSGKKDKAKALLEELQQRSKQKYVSSYSIAQIYAGLGENDQVFAYLNKAFEEHANSLVFIKVDPLFDTLRSDPRFTDLLRRIGLAQ